MRIPSQHFEKHLLEVQKHSGDKWVGPLADVLDTAYAIHLWAVDHGLRPVVDLAALTKLVLERHNQIENEAGTEELA